MQENLHTELNSVSVKYAKSHEWSFACEESMRLGIVDVQQFKCSANN